MDETVDVSRPPGGAWFQRTGMGFVAGATHRSLSTAFGLLFFTTFWNGIVSVFVLLALGATLHHLGLPTPHWFPKGTALPLPMTIFMWLFLTPFIAIGLLTFGAFLSCLAGRTQISIEGGQGTLFSGVGLLGFRKRFSVSEVKDVRIEEVPSRNTQNSRRRSQIVLETRDKPFTFGSMWTDARRQFLAGALKKELLHL